MMLSTVTLNDAVRAARAKENIYGLEPLHRERHLRHLLLSYKTYYIETRTHLSLNKDAPSRRAVEATGRILCLPILGGLHHHYGRM